jgi:hypothetical protein
VLASRSLLLAAALLPGAALASANFPTVVRSEAGLRCTPACVLCHATNAGGTNTVTKPFGQALQAQGAQEKDSAALRQALAQVRDEGVDSDGDGSGDFLELTQLRSPNVAGEPDGGAADPLEVTSPSCISGGGGTDGGTAADGGTPPPPPPEEELLPEPFYGCSSGSGGLAVTGVLLLALGEAVRRRRR